VLPGAAVMLGAFFIVLTRMHERHLLPTLPVLALTCTLWPRYWIPYCVLSGAYFLNLRYVFYTFLPYREFDLSRLDIQTIAFINVTMLGLLLVLLLYLVGSPRLGGRAGHVLAAARRFGWFGWRRGAKDIRNRSALSRLAG
jgi:hypothetical protein